MLILQLNTLYIITYIYIHCMQIDCKAPHIGDSKGFFVMFTFLLFLFLLVFLFCLLLFCFFCIIVCCCVSLLERHTFPISVLVPNLGRDRRIHES